MVEILVTCEHGGSRLPPASRLALRGAASALRCHRGWDPGALRCARRLAGRLGAPLLSSTVSRLVVDANRSPGNPAVFSRWTRRLAPEARAALLARHHRPYWQRVERAIATGAQRNGSVLHLSIHSFVPRLAGRERRFDVGLLYDPGRAGERRLAADWKAGLALLQPELRVRRNAPYRGRDDGLTRALRIRFGPRRYLGLEVELNQAIVAGGDGVGDRVVDALHAALAAVRDVGPGRTATG